MTPGSFYSILRPMPRGRLIALSILTLTLVIAGLILTDAWPALRGPAPETSEWYWPYLLRPVARWWPAFLTGLALVGVGGWWLRRRDEGFRLPLLLLVALNLALQVAFIYADRPAVGAELVDRTLSKASNGYQATAGEIAGLNDALRRFPELMLTFDNEHARTHPPGLIVAHWLTDHALRRVPSIAEALARPATQWRCTDLWVLARPPSVAAALLLWSWAPLLLAALTVAPAYGLSREWFAPRHARLPTLLAAALPALLVFAPTPDQMFACLAMGSLFLLVSGLRRMRWLRVLAAGLVVSLMTFLSLGNAAWVALLAGYALWWWVWPAEEDGASWREGKRWLMVVLLAVSALSFWLVYWIGWGVAPWAVARVGLGQHYELVTSLRRYEWWLGYNLLDFLLFAGLPVALGLIWRAIHAARRRDRLPDGRLALLLVVLLLALNLAGSTRGEVGRLWLVFMPAAAVLAGGIFSRKLNDSLSLWLLLIAQVVLAWSIGLAWRPLYAVILPVERPVMAEASPAAYVDATFLTPDGRELRLMGFDLPSDDLTPGGSMDVTLFWGASGPSLRAYTVFAQLLDAGGAIVAQADGWPAGGLWPTTCWAAGETVADARRLALPEALPPGAYRLVVGLYDAATGARLATAGGAGAVELVRLAVP